MTVCLERWCETIKTSASSPSFIFLMFFTIIISLFHFPLVFYHYHLTLSFSSCSPPLSSPSFIFLMFVTIITSLFHFHFLILFTIIISIFHFPHDLHHYHLSLWFFSCFSPLSSPSFISYHIFHHHYLPLSFCNVIDRYHLPLLFSSCSSPPLSSARSSSSFFFLFHHHPVWGSKVGRRRILNSVATRKKWQRWRPGVGSGGSPGAYMRRRSQCRWSGLMRWSGWPMCWSGWRTCWSGWRMCSSWWRLCLSILMFYCCDGVVK